MTMKDLLNSTFCKLNLAAPVGVHHVGVWLLQEVGIKLLLVVKRVQRLNKISLHVEYCIIHTSVALQLFVSWIQRLSEMACA
jgi:hypothetical protein